MTNTAARFCARILVFAVLLFSALPASAQYRPRPISEPPTGERYHIEASAGFWFPTAEMSVSSGGTGALSGLLGSVIDLKNDLGLSDTSFPEFHVQLRPARSHKFRFQYIPIKYTQGPVTLHVDISFNGQRYSLGLPTNSTLDWKAYRFGYEFDFLTKDWGFVGVVLDLKYTDATATLTQPALDEFVRARAPIPAVGGIGRFYIVPNISVTGEVTGFKLPDNLIEHDTGYYVDIDAYATLNLSNYIGVQGGYRSFDVGFSIKGTTPSSCPLTVSNNTSGCFTLRGPYVGAVVRY
jgi:hypothetical protein